MREKFEVIAAFVDGERVEAEALKQALADAEGRTYLTDIVSLRQAVRSSDTAMAAVAARSTTTRRWLAAAALVVVGVGAGFAMGRRSAPAVAAPLTAPAATRVIELKPGVNWHETGGGR